MSLAPAAQFFREPDRELWTNVVWDRGLAQKVDELSSSEFNICSEALMETAGRAVAKIALDRGAKTHPVIVLCGRGNNGGDGLVAARMLHDQGAKVTVILVAETEKSASKLFSRQLTTLNAMRVPTTTWSPGAISALGLSRPVIIDAVSGLGFEPPCDGILLQALSEAASIVDATVIAVDIPSGISPDDGSIRHAPLFAHETVTFGASRPVQRLMPAATCCGNVTVVDIGFPRAAVEAALAQRRAHWHEVNPHEVLHTDPWQYLPRDAHKYDRGHVLIIGGSMGKIGAPVMTAMAALRSGAGWCSIAIPRGEKPIDMQIPHELTVESFFDGTSIDVNALRRFLNERRVNTIVCGPGWMSQQLTEEAIDCLRSFVLAGGSLVLDAGALHGITALLTKSGPFPPGKILLTPHPGEWNRMQDLAAPPPLTPDGSMSAALQCAKLGIHIIYKNAAPVIISPEQVPPLICAAGTTILARAGAGDLLAGMIAAHLAVGCSPDFAAARAYTLLSRTAWIAAQDVGEDAVIASDITARLGIGARL
jgi:hydroxyethylthiazole kinase-like uncharacterized protein yjeF